VVPPGADTAAFDGQYKLLSSKSFQAMRAQVEAETDPGRKAAGTQLLEMMAARYANFRISQGVIRSGGSLVQEFSIQRATVVGNTLRGTAIWHEDVGDPGDSSEEPVWLRLQGNQLAFVYGEEVASEPTDPIVLERVP
jgi:hypothetical protein